MPKNAASRPLHEGLIALARDLVRHGRRGPPSDARLRRAVSTAYYAMFHVLAREGADQMMRRASRTELPRAWAQVYRSLEHGRVRAVCAASNSRIKNAYRRFPDPIRGFGDSFVQLQAKRHEADYSPFFRCSLSDAVADVATAEAAIRAFLAAPEADRRAFCAFVLFDLRG